MVGILQYLDSRLDFSFFFDIVVLVCTVDILWYLDSRLVILCHCGKSVRLAFSGT